MAARARPVASGRGTTTKKRASPGRLVRRQTKGKAGRKALVIIAVGAMGSMAALFLDSYRIPSRSMEDTVLYGDYLLIEKISYGAEIPFNKPPLSLRAGPAPRRRGDFSGAGQPAAVRQEVRRRRRAESGGKEEGAVCRRCPASGSTVLQVPRSPCIRTLANSQRQHGPDRRSRRPSVSRGRQPR